jgi:hypothetical protein
VKQDSDLTESCFLFGMKITLLCSRLSLFSEMHQLYPKPGPLNQATPAYEAQAVQLEESAIYIPLECYFRQFQRTVFRVLGYFKHCSGVL